MKIVKLSLEMLTQLEKEICDAGLLILQHTDAEVEKGVSPEVVVNSPVFKALQLLNEAVVRLRGETAASVAAEALYAALQKAGEGNDFEFDEEVIEVTKPKVRYH